MDAPALRCYTEDMIAFLRRRRDGIALGAALLLPLAACALLIPSRTSLPNTDAALALVALVAAIAVLGGRAAGWLSAAGTALWFDFFLTVPYERFAVDHRDDIQTIVLLVIVGGIVTELAALAARRRRVVAVDEALLDVIQSTSALVARGEDPDTVISQVTVQLRAVLGLRDCAFQPGRVGAHTPRLHPDGTVHRGGAVWNTEEYGLPDQEIELLARHAGAAYGRFLLNPTPHTAPGIHARRTAAVLADLAATAIALSGSRSTVRHGGRG
jgi:Domain of unknown function (DUF4118)